MVGASVVHIVVDGGLSQLTEYDQVSQAHRL